MITDTQPTMSDVPADLLKEAPTILADLYRETWDYKVRVIYYPELKAPEAAFVTILDRKNEQIDSLVLTVEDGFLAFTNPFEFSPALCTYMHTVEHGPLPETA